MRVVLRVEVEAVKFLKEEPHRLDALLKRCNTMTDALSTLRRYANQTHTDDNFQIKAGHFLFFTSWRRFYFDVFQTCCFYQNSDKLNNRDGNYLNLFKSLFQS